MFDTNVQPSPKASNKFKITALIVATFGVLCSAILFAADGYLPGGTSASAVGDTEATSLKKINSLLQNGSTSGGGGGASTAPTIATATHMAFTGKKGTLSETDTSIVEVITGADNNLWVRGFTVQSVSTNTGNILLRTTTESDYYTTLYPGNVFPFTAAPGGVVNLENLVVKAEDSSTPALTVIYLE